jgi:hypothetical protein
MIEIQHLSLSALQPVDPAYSYSSIEPLQKKHITYNSGLNVVSLYSTENFQDIAFNNETCLILTSSVHLSSFFTAQLFENNFFGSVYLRPRRSEIFYWAYNPRQNSVYLSLSATQVFISPVPGTKEVELLINREYVQVDVNYPYEVTLNSQTLDPESIHRQRFVCTIQDGTATFRTKTNSGDRYLGFSNDGVLRATGTVLNNAVLNDYVFNIEYIAVNTGLHGFIPVNDYVTYYFDIEGLTQNKTLAINKKISNIPTNYLLSFPFNSITDNTTNINIANLKNVVTPDGGPASIDNSYTKITTTTN